MIPLKKNKGGYSTIVVIVAFLCAIAFLTVGGMFALYKSHPYPGCEFGPGSNVDNVVVGLDMDCIVGGDGTTLNLDGNPIIKIDGRSDMEAQKTPFLEYLSYLFKTSASGGLVKVVFEFDDGEDSFSFEMDKTTEVIEAPSGKQYVFEGPMVFLAPGQYELRAIVYVDDVETDREVHQFVVLDDGDISD